MGVEGSVVVITGGASGIGRYLARNFASKGAKLVVADVRPMDTVLGELSELGAEVIGVATDVSDEDSVANLFETAYHRYGRIDTLLNNAAIATHSHTGAPRWPRVRDMNIEFASKVIDTNIVGTLLCCKYALPYMESLNAGHVINFGQGNLHQKDPLVKVIGHGVYGMTKVAIRALTKFVAEEERDCNICIVSMSPGVPGAGPSPGASGPPRGGIITEDSPKWAQDQERDLQTVFQIGDNYVLAAEADMSFSGAQVTVKDGKLVIVDD
jgi:NAD(P)-dependent dehydrogenase (short-subunit alcohol dehydrogenase family)